MRSGQLQTENFACQRQLLPPVTENEDLGPERTIEKPPERGKPDGDLCAARRFRAMGNDFADMQAHRGDVSADPAQCHGTIHGKLDGRTYADPALMMAAQGVIATESAKLARSRAMGD